VRQKSSANKEPIMSVLTVVILNAIVAGTVVAALAYVCRLPFRLDRFVRPARLQARGSEQPHESSLERAA
jgi:hypothetical protein